MNNNPFSFSWDKLTVFFEESKPSFWSSNKTKKILFKNESGKFHSKSLIGIMGPSGVGKTTFLASLAGKHRGVTGSLKLNETLLSVQNLKHISSYLFQEDIYVETLTVFEHFRFMNALKSKKDKNAVNKIIADFNLDKNTEIKNLSGGERKRLTLGVELLNNNQILFCDEPTTGLDSYNANSIIKKLNFLTQKNEKLIFVTIHQPSFEIFNYFTHIILIAPNKVFYQGEKSLIKEFFETKFHLFCPKNYNPADFYLKSISNELISLDQNVIHQISIKSPKRLENFDLLKINNNIFQEIYWLLWRNLIDTRRNFLYHLYQFLLLMITALILASTYSFVSSKNDDFVQNVKGIIFFFTSELIFTHTYNVINTFPSEENVMMREKNLYSTKSYFLSKLLSVIPRCILQPLMFLIINFLLIDFFNDIWVFSQMLLVLFFACISASILAIFTSLDYMDLFTAPFELITMLAAGILIKLPSLKYLNWIKYLSPFYYTYESLSIIFWTNINEMDFKNSSMDVLNLTELGFSTKPAYIYQNIFYMNLLSLFISLICYFTLCYRRNFCVTRL
ncbi:protein brown-like isoform X2 [Onthophagus taurus]|uniref:protein brown-like isoform X2 n=1 Tax=Onthophagus taurus TaxID=166361 RepID=UPI0039BDA487